MVLVLGTDDGVYRRLDPQSGEIEHVRDAGRVMRVRRFGEEVYAASKTGLLRSTDGEKSWTDLGVPQTEVYSIAVSIDGDRIYAGAHPAHLYASDDEGDTWRELDGFQELPSREQWHTPRHRNEAHVRSLGIHPEAPDQVVAGVEVGGVHVSDDRGEHWTERRNGLQDDVHHVLVCGPEEYVASCGGGLYRTRDAGRSWTRLDEDLSRGYFREAHLHDGRLYAAAARSSPGTWRGDSGADAKLFVSDDGGDSFRAVTYPGGPQEIVLAWTAVDDTVVAGTNEGRLIIETTDGWETCGQVSSGIRSLCVA